MKNIKLSIYTLLKFGLLLIKNSKAHDSDSIFTVSWFEISKVSVMQINCIRCILPNHKYGWQVELFHLHFPVFCNIPEIKHFCVMSYLE